MAPSHLDRYWSYNITLSTFELWSKIKSIGRRGLNPNNKWNGEYPVELCFVQLRAKISLFMRSFIVAFSLAAKVFNILQIVEFMRSTASLVWG